jgi:hypothetical protein
VSHFLWSLLSLGRWSSAEEGRRCSGGWSCMVMLGQRSTSTLERLALLSCGGSREWFLLL